MMTYKVIDVWNNEYIQCVGTREEIEELVAILNTGLWILPTFCDEDGKPQFPILSKDPNRTYTVVIESGGYSVRRWDDGIGINAIYADILENFLEGFYGCHPERRYFNSPGELVIAILGEPHWIGEDEVIDFD